MYDAKADQFLQTVLWWELAQNVATKKRIGDQCEKCGSTLNATDLINQNRLLQEKLNHEATKHWFCLWIVMKIS
jgi:methionyl-tRNA synthetase